MTKTRTQKITENKITKKLISHDGYTVSEILTYQKYGGYGGYKVTFTDENGDLHFDIIVTIK